MCRALRARDPSLKTSFIDTKKSHMTNLTKYLTKLGRDLIFKVRQFTTAQVGLFGAVCSAVTNLIVRRLTDVPAFVTVIYLMAVSSHLRLAIHCLALQQPIRSLYSSWQRRDHAPVRPYIVALTGHSLDTHWTLTDTHWTLTGHSLDTHWAHWTCPSRHQLYPTLPTITQN